jgi:uncharacterized membrane protein
MKLKWRTELLQWIALAAMFGLAAWAWPRVPDRVPIHWNLQGEIDGYGGKSFGLLLTPFLSLGIYVLMAAAPLLDPGRRNYRNFESSYHTIRLTLMLFLTALQVVLVMAALGRQVDVALVVSLGVAAMLLVIGNVMGKIRPNWFVGVRTPWTLSSKTSWNKTHRLAGWLFMVMGLTVAVTGVVRTTWMLGVMLGVLSLSVVGMFVYSYVVYRHDQERISPAGVTPADE